MESVYILSAALVLLIGYKVYHFLTRLPGKRIYRLIYFSRYAIIGSSTRERAHAKKIQNILSLAIFVIGIIDAALAYFYLAT
jgi:hypothetical protein